jgi:hypothetical protein
MNSTNCVGVSIIFEIYIEQNMPPLVLWAFWLCIAMWERRFQDEINLFGGVEIHGLSGFSAIDSAGICRLVIRGP